MCCGVKTISVPELSVFLLSVQLCCIGVAYIFPCCLRFLILCHKQNLGAEEGMERYAFIVLNNYSYQTSVHTDTQAHNKALRDGVFAECTILRCRYKESFMHN